MREDFILPIQGIKSWRYAESWVAALQQKLVVFFFFFFNCDYIAQPVENTSLCVLAVVYKGIWTD